MNNGSNERHNNKKQTENEKEIKVKDPNNMDKNTDIKLLLVIFIFGAWSFSVIYLFYPAPNKIKEKCLSRNKVEINSFSLLRLQFKIRLLLIEEGRHMEREQNECRFDEIFSITHRILFEIQRIR